MSIENREWTDKRLEQAEALVDALRLARDIPHSTAWMKKVEKAAMLAEGLIEPDLEMAEVSFLTFLSMKIYGERGARKEVRLAEAEIWGS